VPFGAPYGHFADAASTIKEAQHPRVLAWGPAGDHTLCAMVNDLRVCERHAPLVNHEHRHQPGDMRYRYFLGVKWSQVQLLSARRPKPALTSVGAGFMLLQFLADVWQWASSVPSGREWPIS
jgi:hypothetical protein